MSISDIAITPTGAGFSDDVLCQGNLVMSAESEQSNVLHSTQQQMEETLAA